MRVSIEWIKKLIPDLKAPVGAIEKRLNATGTEVVSVHNPADSLAGVIVGEVRSVEPHPEADRLRVTEVFDGTSVHTVVCGAPNVAAGQRVPFAPVGVTLPNGLGIEPRTIRGIESRGMLCAADELGLALSSEGLMVLKPRTKPGKPVADALRLKDAILELELTPNRPDMLSHFGVARELAALFNVPRPKRTARPKQTRKPAADRVRVRVADKDRCSLYCARVITGVRVKPSPDWVQRRLLGLGQRPVSNVVDATNLILLELGQPLHAFDLDRLAGAEVIVRSAKPGEPILLLDGSTRELSSEDLVIADAERPVALAGVMGGQDSEVGETTTDLLLESALFKPSSVRRTAKQHGLHTEASHRFERGVDPEMVELAIDACAELIEELAGGDLLAGRITAPKRRPSSRPTVSIRSERAAMVMGRPTTRKEIREAMSRLGFKSAVQKTKRASDAMRFEVPSWRHDIRREVDLIEEVARLTGYDQIPTVMPPAVPRVRSQTYVPRSERRVRETLAGLGFIEAVSLGFASEREADVFGVPTRDLVALTNPLGEETRFLRFSLLPALLEAAQRNQDSLPSIVDLRLFELGRAFAWEPERSKVPTESRRVGLLMRGRRTPEAWSSRSEPLDIFDLKGSLEVLLDRVGASRPGFERRRVPWLHPRSSTQIADGETVWGWMGELHPDLMAPFGLEGPGPFLAELDLDRLEANVRPRYFRPPSHQPPAQRDLSFFVPRDEAGADVLQTIREAGQAHHLESVRLFDVYEGRGVPDGQKSLAVALVLRAPDRTLTEPEVESAQEVIIAELELRHGARVRSGA